MEKEISIMSLEVQNEMDVMLAHRRGMQFAKYSGLSLSEQTRFATAVSEICRNSLEYAMQGIIKFSIVQNNASNYLLAVIKDEGEGIFNLPEILERNPQSYKGRGLGIVYARRLSDNFKITSTQKGTTVHIQKNIPVKASIPSKVVIDGWIKHLEKEPVISAYEELKMRNMQLVELSEELKANAAMVEKQMVEIKKLNEQLSKSNERMKEFTYAISHDLKTPLSSLKLSSAYMENNPTATDILIYQGIVSRSVNRLDRTIQSLIEIIDLQNQDHHVIKELAFETLFSETIDEYEQFIKESGAKIETDFSAAPRIAYIEGHLHSLFHNLLSNSLKYKDEKRKLKVRVATKMTTRKIILTFSDNGMGMDMEKIKDRLFMPFTRFSAQVEGKGIGLFLIKSMVESNGGSVAVDSNVGNGTTFTFSLVPYKLGDQIIIKKDEE